MAGVARALILAAGAGRRMGGDKALLDLGGTTAIERVVKTCRAAGVDEILVVRAAGHASLPAAVAGKVATVVAPPGEMTDSLRAGLRAAGPMPASVLVFPVDYAMVGPRAVAAVLAQLGGPVAIGLPLWEGRPGHPIALSAAAAAEVLAPTTTTLRDVVAADRTRVGAVAVDDPWVRHDLDTPADLAQARASLAD